MSSISSTQNNDGSVKCPLEGCGKTISRKHDLERHLDTHDPSTAERHPCEVAGCTKGVREKSNLRSHLLTQHGIEKPYTRARPAPKLTISTSSPPTERAKPRSTRTVPVSYPIAPPEAQLLVPHNISYFSPTRVRKVKTEEAKEERFSVNIKSPTKSARPSPEDHVVVAQRHGVYPPLINTTTTSSDSQVRPPSSKPLEVRAEYWNDSPASFISSNNLSIPMPLVAVPLTGHLPYGAAPSDYIASTQYSRYQKMYGPGDRYMEPRHSHRPGQFDPQGQAMRLGMQAHPLYMHGAGPASDLDGNDLLESAPERFNDFDANWHA